MRIIEHIVIHSEINGRQYEISNNLSTLYKCMQGFVCRVDTHTISYGKINF